MRVCRVPPTALACLLLAACATSDKRVVPVSDDGATTRVYVVPELTTRTVDAFTPFPAVFSTVGAFASLPGYFAGLGLDAVIGIVRYQKQARVRAALNAAFPVDDFEQHFLGIINPLPEVAGADLRVRSAEGFDGATWEFAGNLVTAAGADAVISLQGAYRMTPAKDQLVVTILMHNYRARQTGGRADVRPAKLHLTRRYTYMSPQHALEKRAFRPGEKAALAADIRARYDADLVAFDDPQALAKARDAELADLESADTVPEYLQLSQTWTQDRGRTYLAQAAEHLRYMVETDWHGGEFGADPSAVEWISVSRGNGRMQAVEAVRLEATATHAIMRSLDFGHLYAIPLTSASAQPSDIPRPSPRRRK